MQIREEVAFTKGRIIVRGKLVTRGKAKRADYILYYKPNIPIAIIEAKDNNHSVGDGMQQAPRLCGDAEHPVCVLVQRRRLCLPRPHRHERRKGSHALALDAFPSPDELWAQIPRLEGTRRPTSEAIVLQDYFDDGSGKATALLPGQCRQRRDRGHRQGPEPRFCWSWPPAPARPTRPFRSSGGYGRPGARSASSSLPTATFWSIRRWSTISGPSARPWPSSAPGRKPSSAQTAPRSNSPRPSTKSAASTPPMRSTLGLYQAITGPEERQKLFREFSPGFFDLIVIDECHRGSAAEDSAWREILESFLRRDADRPHRHAQGNRVRLQHPLFRPAGLLLLAEAGHPGRLPGPVQGHQGPYRRGRAGLSAGEGRVDRDGNEIEDRIYNTKDFDRTLVIDDRTKLVAKKVSEFLKESGDRFQKTIVFCVDEEHAARMRQALINENKDLCNENHRYVMRITGSDTEGQAQLGNFIDPEAKYPVLVTTSRLLSTGVDAQTCRLIVLDRAVGSMTEFKQIVGRGTRVHEDTKKFYFTLIDFRGATNHFADPDFDGEPVQIYEPGEDDPIVPPDDVPPVDENGEPVPPAAGR